VLKLLKTNTTLLGKKTINNSSILNETEQAMTQDQLKKLLAQSGITLKIDGTYSGDLADFARLLDLHTDWLDQIELDNQANWANGYGMN
jgi:hypothetical protein